MSERPKADASDLELPDWSGMVDSGRLVDPKVALSLIEHYYRLLPNKDQILKQRAEQHVDVEFVL